MRRHPDRDDRPGILCPGVQRGGVQRGSVVRCGFGPPEHGGFRCGEFCPGEFRCGERCPVERGWFRSGERAAEWRCLCPGERGRLRCGERGPADPDGHREHPAREVDRDD
ncbi:MAG: hypothetical protein U0841_31130, partial [Chloroflexia bacterium]